MMKSKVKDEGGGIKIAKSQLPTSNFQILAAALYHATLTLASAHIDSPRLTAEVLLAQTLGVTRTQALTHPERQLPPAALAQFQDLIARAAHGEPLAYLTGHKEFYGYDFLVDSRVLIPRPETELLIDLVLRHLVTLSPCQVLDIGTGSGCIAITLALKLPSAQITAVDISPDALALARLNAGRHGISHRVDFIQSDLLSALQLPARRASNFQLLIANLPYVTSRDVAHLAFEPALALDGGPDGLALLRRLLADAPRVMAPPSGLLLEINDAYGEATLALARAAFPSGHIELHQDLAGLDRILAIAL
jgi:release factor glutamine methyltransferase